MKKNLLIICVILSVFFLSFIDNTQERELRPISKFSAVEVGSGIDLYLKPGNSVELAVECDKSAIHRIVTEVDGKVLKISAMSNTRWSYDRSPRVFVTYDSLKAITTSGGSDVRGQGIIQCADFAIVANGGSDVYLNIECNNLRIEASGGSDVKVAGKANYLNAEAISGSDINAIELMATRCKITASGGSDALVNVLDDLVAHASGGSDIGYMGNPAIKEIVESGGSDVFRK